MTLRLNLAFIGKEIRVYSIYTFVYKTVWLIMPPTSEKLEGHFALGLSVCTSVTLFCDFLMVHVRDSEFHMCIPHEKIVDPYFFSCPSYVPFLSYVPLKTKVENIVCKIHVSQNVFELEPSYLVY